jgi:general secretion pathway protein B
MPNDNVIHIDALQPGMFVVSIVAQHGPVKIRKQGHIASFDMVKGLKEMGVTELAIDPAQTLEIDAPAPSETKQSQSPTQHLLMQKDARQVDSQMSEQFNRSVFLPSIQRLPGFWQIQGPRLLKFVSVGVAGIVLGYSATWWYLQPHPTLNDSPLAVSEPALPPPATTGTPAVNEPDTNTTVPPSVAVGTKTTAETAEIAAEDTSAITPVTALIDETGDETDDTGVLLTQQTPTFSASPAVQAKLAEVLAEIDTNPPSADNDVKVTVTSNDDLPRIGQLPAHLLTRMPNMIFAQHLYASVASERWVRVNNRRMQEGDVIEGRVTIIAIEPQQVVLEIDGTRFTMAALTDW